MIKPVLPAIPGEVVSSKEFLEGIKDMILHLVIAWMEKISLNYRGYLLEAKAVNVELSIKSDGLERSCPYPVPESVLEVQLDMRNARDR